MKHKNSGFTLVEIIVSLALICIIAIGLIPAFATQLKITIETKKITEQSFDAQGEIERVIMDLKGFITNPAPGETTPAGITVQTKTIFGRSVDLYRLEQDFPTNENKSFLVFLSKKLAQMEVRQLLFATGVRIEVSDETVHKVADLKKTPKPTLKGLCNANTDPNWYVNIYNWYVSKEGDPSPAFPDDYEKLTFAGATPATLTDLSKLANKYVVFGVTPVDIHGIRGNEATSNVVYVLGEEWRSGKFAWVDKNEDALYTGGTDVEVKKTVGLTWPLVKDVFDTKDEFPDPDHPEIMLKPVDGSLYVPMWINRSTENPVVTIEISGTDALNWIVDKSIHLSTDISVGNDSHKDITLKTRDGNVTLYQFVEINPATGKVVYNADGLPSLLERGAALNAPYGNITFGMEGRGKVILQNFTKLVAGKDIAVEPYGDINLYKASLEAGGSIVLNNTKGLTFAGERNIDLENSSLILKNNGVTDRGITVKSRNSIIISGSAIQGNSDQKSSLSLIASDDITLKDTRIRNSEVLISSDTKVINGGWDANSVLSVADGTSLRISPTSGQVVENEGALKLGDTGGISFAGDMEDNLANRLRINLVKDVGNDDVVILSTNYGRNVTYADSDTGNLEADGEFESLGQGSTNLEYALVRRSGSGNPALSFSYNGNDRIEVTADRAGESTDEISCYYELLIADRYAEDVIGSAVFKVTAREGESPSVRFMESGIPTYTVTFNRNGGSADSIPSSMPVKDGEAVGSLPTPPRYFGYTFVGWYMNADGSGSRFTESTVVTGNITVYAKYSLIPVYTVTFNSNGANVAASPASIKVEQGGTVGTLPTPPQKTGNWFKNWTLPSSAEFTASTVINSNITVTAQWTPKKTFSGIDTGEYIVISGVKFQKIGDNQILAVNRVPNGSNYDMNWGTADSLATNYRSSFNTINWITGSGLVDGGLLGTLINNNFGSSILDIDVSWWGGTYDSNRAYYINSSGAFGSASYYKDYKNSNAYSCRPYISVNSTNLYVSSGDGSQSNPYQLMRE